MNRPSVTLSQSFRGSARRPRTGWTSLPPPTAAQSEETARETREENELGAFQEQYEQSMQAGGRHQARKRGSSFILYWPFAFNVQSAPWGLPRTGFLPPAQRSNFQNKKLSWTLQCSQPESGQPARWVQCISTFQLQRCSLLILTRSNQPVYRRWVTKANLVNFLCWCNLLIDECNKNCGMHRTLRADCPDSLYMHVIFTFITNSKSLAPCW